MSRLAASIALAIALALGLGKGEVTAQPAIGLTSQLYFAAPYEDMRLKKP